MAQAEQRSPNGDPEPPRDNPKRGSGGGDDDKEDDLVEVLVGKLKRTFRIKKPDANS